MKPIKGICKECLKEAEELDIQPEEKWIANKSRMLCLYHNEKRKADGKKKRTYKRRVTGEGELFKEIWAEREHRSFVSGVRLKYFDVSCFAHLIPKGSYPAYRLRKENIILLTPDEHHKFDHASHEIKDDPKWKKVFEMVEELKRKYNEEFKIKKF